MAADGSSEAHNSDEAPWNPTADQTSIAWLATTAAWIYNSTEHSNIPTLIKKVQSKQLQVSDAEATAA